MGRVVDGGFKIHVAAVRFEDADRHFQPLAGEGIVDGFKKLAVDRIDGGVEICRRHPAREVQIAGDLMTHEQSVEMVFQDFVNPEFMLGIADREFADDPDVPNSFGFEAFGHFPDFVYRNGGDFTAAVIDGTGYCKIMRIGAIKFRTDSGAA